MIYWDTCCVLKLYAKESDSEFWLRAATKESSALYTSQLTRSELAFALIAKEQRKELKPGAADILLSKFEQDIQRGLYHPIPLSSSVIDRSIRLARHLPHPGLRTLDGLHLATALESGCSRIATQDRRLLKATRQAGLESLTH